MHALFFKQFLFVSYDPEMAATLGYRVAAWNLLLYVTFGIVIALAMQYVGVLLVFSYLVLPGGAGILLGRRLRSVFVVSAATAGLGTLLGFILSIAADVPTGASIIIAMGALAAGAGGVARLRRRDVPSRMD